MVLQNHIPRECPLLAMKSWTFDLCQTRVCEWDSCTNKSICHSESMNRTYCDVHAREIEARRDIKIYVKIGRFGGTIFYGNCHHCEPYKHEVLLVTKKDAYCIPCARRKTPLEDLEKLQSKLEYHEEKVDKILATIERVKKYLDAIEKK